MQGPPIIIPPALGVLCAQAVERWRLAAERYEAANKGLVEAQGAWTRAEKDLRELSRAVSIVLHTTAHASQAAAPSSASNHASNEMPASDAILAWMQAGSPTDSDGNMLVPPPRSE
jgi:hypothetical protein